MCVRSFKIHAHRYSCTHTQYECAVFNSRGEVISKAGSEETVVYADIGEWRSGSALKATSNQSGSCIYIDGSMSKQMA